MNETVKDIYLLEGVSSRTGKQYIQLVVEFRNGYTFKVFLNDEQKFALQASGLEVKH